MTRGASGGKAIVLHGWADQLITDDAAGFTCSSGS